MFIIEGPFMFLLDCNQLIIHMVIKTRIEHFPFSRFKRKAITWGKAWPHFIGKA